MIVNGLKIKKEIAADLRNIISEKSLRLSVADIKVGNDPVVDTFISKKKKYAEAIGVDFEVFAFPETVSQEELLLALHEITKEHDGVIVQLPLPLHIDTAAILNSIPQEKDIDVLSEKAQAAFRQGEMKVLPPVVGAVAEIIERNNISLIDKKIAVLGSGKLVGQPMAAWFKHQQIEPIIFDINNPIDVDILRTADIIVSGMGVAGCVTSDMVKDGVIIIDAGTSDEGGTLSGDVDPSVADKASVFTPVPGGVGPITVAILFKNLITLHHGA